jgi:hypothetical protein
MPPQYESSGGDSRLRRLALWAWRGTLLVIGIIGLAGVPDDATTWSTWLSAHQDLARWALVITAILAYAVTEVLRRHFIATTRQRFAAWRERRKLRDWTSAGLNWEITGRGTMQSGATHACLSIRPVQDSELPQPLDFIVTCAGLIAEVSSRFYRDESRLEGESSGNVEIGRPEGKSVRLKLLSPKLLPPARLDLTVVSKGNAEVQVVDVRRAPK